ncbi:MAG: GNAT family N-acetyltransferase, partial [Oscillospiraceae bacterium]|nr:GNAT family N-acetyltransferase [Oscillospiraceae bacterium]
MDFTICDAAPRHIPQIEALEKLCFPVPWTREQLTSQLKDGQHEFLAAVDAEDRVLGYVGMMYVLDEGYISNVAVDPSHRREGIGDALIERLLARCWELAL